MAQAGVQHKLDRVRPPRVHITYDVEVGDAIELRQLPFQLGVLGDFSGMPQEPLPRFRDRKFVEVNPDNFTAVMEGIRPRLALTVDNKLTEQPGAPQLKVDLLFKSLDDFEPESVARQVKPLRELLELRSKLSDLLGKLQGNDRLDELLMEAITDPNKLNRLKAEIGPARPAPAPETAAPPASIETAPEPGPAAAEAEASVAEAEPITPTPEIVAEAPEILAEASEAAPEPGSATELEVHAESDAAEPESTIAAEAQSTIAAEPENPETEPDTEKVHTE